MSGSEEWDFGAVGETSVQDEASGVELLRARLRPVPAVPTMEPEVAEEVARPQGVRAADLSGHTAVTAPVAPSRGWRAAAHRVGLKVRPSKEELELRRDTQAITRTLPGPVLIGVANVRGGVGKTTSTIALASALGFHRGGGVAVADIWPRGNIGSQTVDHGSRLSIVDFVEDLPQLLAPTTRAGDVASYLRFQPSGKFGVLAAPEEIVAEDDTGAVRMMRSTMTGHQVHGVIEVLQRFHQIVLVDSGNNDADEAWRAAVERMDQLVIPVRWTKDAVTGAAQVLETLTDTGYEELASSAILVATHGRADLDKVPAATARQRREFFLEAGHTIIDLPSDPLIAAKGVIEFDGLHETTRRAALRLGAAVMDRVATRPRPRKR